jgi:ribosomal protein S18 acetylase RimI-like enzyme
LREVEIGYSSRRMTDPSIRAATIDDADAIAALHAASWRSSYRGILCDETLGPGLDEERRAHWRAALACSAERDVVLLADGLAFIAVWNEGDPEFGAYLDNLHVHPDRRGSGIGRRLMGAVAERLAARGEHRLYLWVFDANVRTIEFYLRLGGEIVERGFIDIDGRRVPQSRVVWHDTEALAKACG